MRFTKLANGNVIVQDANFRTSVPPGAAIKKISDSQLVINIDERHYINVFFDKVEYPVTANIDALFDELSNNFFFRESVKEQVEELQNLAFKIAYYAEITTISGQISIPTNAQIILDQWANGVDAVISKIVGNNPDFKDTGVDVVNFDINGNFALSGALPSSPAALIYYITISLKDYGNLDPNRIIEYSELKITPITSHSQLSGLLADDHLQYLLLAGRGGQNINDAVNIGDVTGGNYTEIQSDGTIKFKGNATVWDDIAGNLIARRLNSTTGRLNYNYPENSITMQNNGDPTKSADRLIFNFQYPHKGVKTDAVAGTQAAHHLHIHWWQVTANRIEWQVDYRIQLNGENKATAWTTVTANSVDNSEYPYVSGIINQVTNLVVVNIPEPSLSATVQYRLTRIDGTPGDIDATFVDVHVEFDAIGSRLEDFK